ncbi:hypothetical protein [Vibrio agarivorans]|uniref:hypothetical protein n=1 Tax=Vibrio agarivorans TaxID=153622 RepID=UPI00223107B4|nr:hypothetical protein [Vibrio agarivorans]
MKSDFPEKQQLVNLNAALAWSARQAFLERNYLSCNTTPPPNSSFTIHKYLDKKNLPPNTSISLSKWKENRSIQQKVMMLTLAMHINIINDGDTDCIFPFTIHPLKRNEKLYNSSDSELAAYFNKHLNAGLRALGIEPEYYYVITEGAKSNEIKGTRHIHGSIRLPIKFFDDSLFNPTDPIYELLKRACGLTEVLRKKIEKEEGRSSDYKFAIAARNSKELGDDKPYGRMVDIGCPLSRHWTQTSWQMYVAGDKNFPNSLHKTKNLGKQAEALNDDLVVALTKLKRTQQWNQCNDRFVMVAEAWSKSITDYLDRT